MLEFASAARPAPNDRVPPTAANPEVLEPVDAGERQGGPVRSLLTNSFIEKGEPLQWIQHDPNPPNQQIEARSTPAIHTQPLFTSEDWFF